ncbi:unnamed protein product [Brassica napus]|uniref:(rape) hypothetical protein n=1 Tax=Brassica napus TaxID=3708 RepID=A0A816W404_BRANA|nr:unnamed protein product [Brassica napus]
MPGKKKLQLALIIIVDGVLIVHQQTPRPTLKYVRMVQDVDTFCSHPWGPNRSNGSAPQAGVIEA